MGKALVEYKKLSELTAVIRKGDNPMEEIQAIKPETRLWIVSQMQTESRFIKKRPGRGNTQLSYVEGHYVRSLLNFFFSGAWSFETLSVVKTEIEYIVRGKLTLKMSNGDAFITATGGSDIKFNKAKQIISEADDQKSAETDCLKKCASQFGFAADVYAQDIKRSTHTEQATETVNPMTPEQKKWMDKILKSQYFKYLTKEQQEKVINCKSKPGASAMIEYWFGDSKKKIVGKRAEIIKQLKKNAPQPKEQPPTDSEPPPVGQKRQETAKKPVEGEEVTPTVEELILLAQAFDITEEDLRRRVKQHPFIGVEMEQCNDGELVKIKRFIGSIWKK